MTDIKCPYCGEDQDIDHDDGYGFEEDTKYQQECNNCEQEFNYYTITMMSYNVICRDDDHKMIDTTCPELKRCSNCDYSARVDELKEAKR